MERNALSAFGRRGRYDRLAIVDARRRLLAKGWRPERPQEPLPEGDRAADLAKQGVDVMGRLAAGALLLLSASAAPAQNAAPLLQPKPVFVPGMYETESRNSAFKNEGVKSRGCIASADFDAFQRETIAQYLKSPQFMRACTLSDTRRTPDGFAFAMDCGGAKTIIAFHFAKDLVSSVTDTKIVARPEYSSSILTLSRRVGDCKGQDPGKPL